MLTRFRLATTESLQTDAAVIFCLYPDKFRSPIHASFESQMQMVSSRSVDSSGRNKWEEYNEISKVSAFMTQSFLTTTRGNVHAFV